MNGVRVLLRRSREEIIERVRLFAEKMRRVYGECIRGVYVIGSVARGQHGPRSDVDVVVVLDARDSIPYHVLKKEAVDIIDLPVDLLVIDERELELHRRRETRFYRELLGGEQVL